MNRLEEIRQRESKASKGPWKQTHNIKYGVKIWNDTDEALFAVISDASHSQITESDQVPQWQKDCDFVREGRMDIPYLLELNDELLKTCAVCHAMLAVWAIDPDKSPNTILSTLMPMLQAAIAKAEEKEN